MRIAANCEDSLCRIVGMLEIYQRGDGDLPVVMLRERHNFASRQSSIVNHQSSTVN